MAGNVVSGNQVAGRAGGGRAAPKTGTAKEPEVPEINESNIDMVEHETIDKVNKTISVLEASIATWDASKEKPPELSETFERYKKFHDALTEWETKALRSLGKEEDYDTKLKRLREFVDVCYSYA